MKHSVAIALALTAPLAVMADTTVFSDNFSSSTIQSATPGAGTANSADYEVFTQGAAPGASGSVFSINPNDLQFGTPTTAGVLGEVEARFGSSPVTLASIGDSITLELTFVDTANVLIAGQNANSSINIGLFNSGNVNLNQGVRLDGTQITGGSQTWQGYFGRLFLNGSASTLNRASQAVGTSTTSQNQDLLFANASGSAAFNNPNGTATTGNTGGTTGFTAGLTQGSTYTFSYTISLTAANAVKITDQLFTGSDTTGTMLINQSGTSTGGNFLGSTFDSLAFGYRQNNAPGGALTASLDINNIIVTTNVPEPTTLALSAFGGLGLLAMRRFKNKK